MIQNPGEIDKRIKKNNSENLWKISNFTKYLEIDWKLIVNNDRETNHWDRSEKKGWGLYNLNIKDEGEKCGRRFVSGKKFEEY